MAETLTPRKRGSWLPLIVVVAVVLVVALAINTWNHQQQQSNIDNGVNQFTELCADSADC